MLGIIVLLALIFLASRWLTRDLRRRLLPPGPPSDPLIGHARVFPRHNSEVVFTEWAKQYGDVVYVHVFGKSILILNTQEAAADLLERRSGKYSSRPAFPIHQLVGWGDLLGITPYNDHFLRQRKIFQRALSRQKCLVYQPMQLFHTQILLKNLLLSAKDFSEHVSQFTTAVMMEIVYAHNVTSKDDEYVQAIRRITQITEEMANNQLLMFLPILKYLPGWFPGASFIRMAKDTVPLAARMRNEPFVAVQRQMAAGTAKACFVSLQLEAYENEGATEEDIYELKVAATQMYSGGAETTWATIMIFVATMLLHPEVQGKAYAELVSVLGPDRLPDFADRPSLPYIESMMYEVMRWHPTTPLGVPHQGTADDMYKGMYIPKDTMVIGNATAMSQDEKVYKDPLLFRPERFLPPNPEPLPTDFFFGFGRRLCPGKYLAEASVWLVMASILTAFEIRPVANDQGKEVMPEITFSTGMTSHPDPFKCSFRPRSQRVANIIRQL